MKNILTLPTGIVILITVLAAGGCRNSNKKNDSPKEEILNDSPKQGILNDSTVVVYLKAIDQGGRKHLKMYNGKDSLNAVVDSLYTVVYPGYTVIWKKAHKSDIKKINQIRPIKKNGKIFSEGAREVKDLIQITIPSDAEPDTIKYDIVFTDKDDIIWCIDPYLRIPPGGPTQ
jgi:hypothetical protein